jgi:hypothetical protein
MQHLRARLKAALKRFPGIRSVVRRRSLRDTHERFQQEFESFAALTVRTNNAQRFALRWEDRYPCLDDRTPNTGFDRHYVYHTAWAARVLANIRPTEHVDIGSSLYFSGIASAFVSVRFYDYRPPDLKLSNLTSERADLLRLPFADSSIPSLSCMHVVEHVGLGRYGDPLDPDGDRKAMTELSRVICPGGNLIFVVPVGQPRVCFNAHRIYDFGQVRNAFRELDLKGFALVPDDPALGGLIEGAAPALVSEQTYGCGCFWFQKPTDEAPALTK